MIMAISEAKAKLTKLARLAEAGEDVVLTRNGQPSVRLVAVRPRADEASRQAVLDAARALPSKPTPGPDAARSQDFLYDEFGLPA